MVNATSTPSRHDERDAGRGCKPGVPRGRHRHRGNAAGLNDGAAALVIAEEGYASAPRPAPLARVVGSAVAGVDPAVMGIGPVPATRKLLARAGLASASSISSSSTRRSPPGLACIRKLGPDPERVNVNGGAIAIGHPLGSTGARMLVDPAHELRRRDGRLGLATMCIGVGQGMALALERGPAG